VRSSRVWARLLGLKKTTVEGVVFDEDEQAVIVSVRPHRSERSRCGICRRRCGRYDNGEGPRRWRALDLGSIRAHVEAEAPRVRCPEHRVVVAAVPWARHNTGHTRDFDDTVAWLATACSKSAVTELMRIAWRTVGAIITRVCSDIDASVDRLAGLRRIGIDEISYRKGQKYLIVVVDHDSGRLIWARPGRDSATLETFFDELGPERSAALSHVSADTASWIASTVAA
jgi:transposase